MNNMRGADVYTVAYAGLDIIDDILYGASCFDRRDPTCPIWEYLRSPSFLKRLYPNFDFTAWQIFKLWKEYVEFLEMTGCMFWSLEFSSWLMKLLQKKMETYWQSQKLTWGTFVEFPNRRRPPCTTMPWSISPALVVLWGVCWMFYSTSLSNELPLVDFEGNTRADNSGFENTDEDLSWDTIVPFSSVVEPSSSAAFHSMNFWQASWNDLVVSTPFEFQQPDPANGNFIQPTRVPPASMLTLDSSVSDILEAPISRPDELFAAGQATGVNTNFLDDHIFYERTATEYGPRLHHTNDAPAEERTSHIPREQNHVFQGNTKCEFPKCRHLSFEDQPEFRLHNETHHKCTVPDCKQTELFSAKGQLVRHKRSVHGIGPSKLYFCDQPNCKRGTSGRGFIRKDNLLQHARVHQEEMRHRKRIRISSYEAETRDPSSEERMTLFEDDSIPQDRETSPRRKRVRSLSPPKFIEKSSSHDVFQSSGAIVGALVTENQELKAKVTRLERVIAGLECALAQVVKK